jgi:hypothetical protein
MNYSDITEAWNNPLGNQINDLQRLNQIHNKVGSIIPPWGSCAEPIDDYLTEQKMMFSGSRGEAAAKTHGLQESSFDGSRTRAPLREPKEQNNAHKEKEYDHHTKEEKKKIKKSVSTDKINDPGKISCDDIENHIYKCPVCYRRYVNCLEINESDFESNKNIFDPEFRKMLMVVLCGIGVIMLLDFVFKNLRK